MELYEWTVTCQDHLMVIRWETVLPTRAERQPGMERDAELQTTRNIDYWSQLATSSAVASEEPSFLIVVNLSFHLYKTEDVKIDQKGQH